MEIKIHNIKNHISANLVSTLKNNRINLGSLPVTLGKDVLNLPTNIGITSNKCLTEMRDALEKIKSHLDTWHIDYVHNTSDRLKTYLLLYDKFQTEIKYCHPLIRGFSRLESYLI